MKKTLDRNELIDIVSAANIAGHMEKAGAISLPDDETLLLIIEQEMESYASAVSTALGEDPDADDCFNWHDWIADALIREYGTNE